MATKTELDKILNVIAGDPWHLPITWQAPSGAPVDISSPGYVVTARLDLEPADVHLTCTKTGGPGRFVVSMSEQDTARVPPGKKTRIVIRAADPGGGVHYLLVPVTGAAL